VFLVITLTYDYNTYNGVKIILRGAKTFSKYFTEINYGYIQPSEMIAGNLNASQSIRELHPVSMRISKLRKEEF
jgi:hypothetical protein